VSDQPGTPPQPFYNQSPLPNQQQPQTRQSWPQTGTNFGYPQQTYPQQSQWNQMPPPQYRYPQQTQYTGQFVQNNVLTPQPPQFQQVLSKPSKRGFFSKKVSVPVWAITLVIVLFISAFATSIYEIGNKSHSVNTPAITSSSSTVGPDSSIPTSIPTSASVPTSIPTTNGSSNVGNTITVNGVSCTLVSVQPIQGDGITQPKPGDTFIVVHIKMSNNSGSDFQYFALNFQAISSTGNATYGVLPPSTYTANNEIEQGTLVPGGSFQGDLIFEVATGDHKAELSWQPNTSGNATQNVWNLGL
jgi:Domain of unknown function (DUF4352)